MNERQDSIATALVVDDEENLGRLMSTTLERGGFRVLTANNGADALALCQSARPQIDLLVTDYSMPGMTGLELARQCREFNSEMVVLYVSGSSPGNALLSDLEPGKRVFLAKPFSVSELLRAAKALTARQPAMALHGESHRGKE